MMTMHVASHKVFAGKGDLGGKNKFGGGPRGNCLLN